MHGHQGRHLNFGSSIARSSNKNNMSSNSQNIQVAVRCRPLNDKEKKTGSTPIIECNEKRKEVMVMDKNSAAGSMKTFTFDKVFSSSSKQIDVYNQVVKPLVLEVIEGYNCTIFAYGQTGTGKTFTMEGDRIQPANGADDISSWENDPLVGIIPRSVAQLFANLNAIQNCEYSVKISFMELYNEELSDLLSDSSENEKLRIFDDANRKGSVVIPGLEEIVVKNKNEVYRILQKGAERRQKASTLMNAQSSRSHSIFCVTVFIKEKSIEGEETIKVGKLNLVDLAGSENIERSGATGKRAAEAGKINKSLTTLGRVITALVEHRDHIPYRESNLTRLLQDSLGGKTKTSIIATISPAAINLEETMSTLDYAYKAKSIRNKPEVNQKLVKQALIKEYTEEIDKLKRELISQREKSGVHLPNDIYNEMLMKLDSQKEEIRDHLLKISNLTDEVDKLTELYNETKRELDEKIETLRATTHKLLTTEVKLTAMTKECNETKYLLEEQCKTEKKLYDQASRLQKTSYDMQNDYNELQSKVSRCTDVITRNRDLTNEFAQYMIDRFVTVLSQQNELTEFNKESFCQICHLLTDLDVKITEMKAENQCQIQIFDEKQKNWLKNHREHLQENVVDLFAQFANDFVQSGNEHQQKNKQTLEETFDMCNKHKELYMKKYNDLLNSIDKLNNENRKFEQKFSELANNFLSHNSNEITLATKESITKLSKLESSIENAKMKSSELTNLTNNFKTYVSESLNALQSTILNLTSKINDTFEMIGNKFDDLNRESELNAEELIKLRDIIYNNEKSLIKAQSTTFESSVINPVKEMIYSNSNSFSHLKQISESLNEKYETTCSNYDHAISMFSTQQEDNINDMNKLIYSTVSQLDKNTNKINTTIDSFDNESRNFLNDYNQSIETEANSLNSIISDSVRVVTETRDANENTGIRFREFLENGNGAVNHFSQKDYTDDQPTGNTPKRKRFDIPSDLEKTRPHEELLELFRNSHNHQTHEETNLQQNGEKKLSADGRISTFFPNNVEMTNENQNTTQMAPPQQIPTPQSNQSQQPIVNVVKKLSSDKENSPNLTIINDTKQSSSLSKASSQSKIARAPSVKQFNVKN